MNNEKKFVTYFPHALNVHITKGIGLIPNVMACRHGYVSYVASYGSEDMYPALKQMPGLKQWQINKLNIPRVLLKLISKIFGHEFIEMLDGVNFLRKNAPDIDVLQLYHIQDKYIGYLARCYKKYNPSGVLYLKLDCGIKTYETCVKNMNSPQYSNAFYRLRINLLKKYSDIISIESLKLKSGLEEIFQKELLYIPCGCYENGETVDFDNKQDYFLTVANLSLWKGTDVLIKAFAEIADKCDWDLILAGPIIAPLENEIGKLYRDYPHLIGRVHYVGNVTEKAELYDYYKMSKIYVMPTQGESFGTVFVEAMYNGCYIILTDMVTPAEEIVTKNSGAIIKVGDVEQLKKEMLKAVTMSFDISYCENIHRKYMNTFSYNSTLDILNDRIKSLLNENSR